VLPLAHFENETSRATGRSSSSPTTASGEQGGVCTSSTSPSRTRPRSRRAVVEPAHEHRARPGHIANCVKEGCRWVWLTGGNRVWVSTSRTRTTRLWPASSRRPRPPATRCSVPTARRAPARSTTSSATRRCPLDHRLGRRGAYDAKTRTPAAARDHRPAGTDPTVNDYILHNSIRPSAAAYRKHSGKNLARATCSSSPRRTTSTPARRRRRLPRPGQVPDLDVRASTRASGSACSTSGRPRPRRAAAQRLEAPVTANCSSHWFKEQHGVAAVGCTSRACDCSTRATRDIRQIGYWLPPNGVTWPVLVSKDIVYTADTARHRRAEGQRPHPVRPTVVAPIARRGSARERA